jgi:molybdopterin-guanine dinucleotide biosynthesis protein A
MFTLSVQAGGESSRMGEDKALKPFLGRPLILRVIERLAPVADEVIITTNQPQAYAFLNLPLFADLQPGRGALGGLYTALASANGEVVGVAACDMPFASQSLFEHMHRLLVRHDADVVVPHSGEGLEPLHAVYRRQTCLPAIQAALEAELWKVIGWFPQVKVYTLKPGQVKRLDPAGLAFWNLNTPDDFAEAERRCRD